ncbi:uncharacterized protein METZ01_LOCUS358490, partial [marine metagenome]
VLGNKTLLIHDRIAGYPLYLFSWILRYPVLFLLLAFQKMIQEIFKGIK